MAFVTDLEHELGLVQHRVDGLVDRLKLSWDTLTQQLEPEKLQAIVGLLQRAHDQAQYTIAHGDLPPGQVPVPWELAHGLSFLHLGAAKPLPQTVDELPTRVLKDGSLLGCRKWELLDPLWSEALISWIENLHKHATFGATPALVTIEDEVLLDLAGDWGTGYFQANSAAQRVADLIRQEKPDFTVHLGDVYYSGNSTEEGNDLTDWPLGQQGTFSLNSNHEMYSGAHAYFSEVGSLFPGQRGTSYFALVNSHWLIVGLDSAYYSDPMGLYMDGNLGPEQQQWLKTLVSTQGQGKKIMLLSHHQGLDITGQNPTPLYQQVYAALGNRAPDYWYWGHLHNGICYAPKADMNGMNGRCIGHGAIPYGDASELDGAPGVLWSETQLAGDPNYPLRVRNGYVRVRLQGDTITEAFVGENGAISWPLA